MTPTGDAGNEGAHSYGGRGKVDSTESALAFEALESQLSLVSGMADRITRKHWPKTERERYPFWAGVFLIAVVLSGIQLVTNRFTREVQWVPLVIALFMLIVLVALLVYYLYRLQSRFERQWAEMSADGELYRFLHDAGVAIGHPAQMGQPDERFSTHLEVPFADAVRSVEAYLRRSALREDVSEGESGFHVPASVLQEPPGGEGHRIYEVEYRGSVVEPLSLRISSVERGTDVVIGFTRQAASAESRERMALSLAVRLQERLIAARVLADIRKEAQVPPVPIPAIEEVSFAPRPATSRAL